MVKVDLHMHSRGSRQPVRYDFLAFFGSPFKRFRESYIDPEKMYDECKAKGMDLVTVTDHNFLRESLNLHQSHPLDTIVGAEYTVKASEKGHHIEVLVYEQDMIAHRELMRLRKVGLEEFVGFCKKEDLAHVMAHPAWPVYPKPKIEFKLLDSWVKMFKVIEVRNGGVGIDNILAEKLAENHGLSGTGGSDAHSIVGIADTWTESSAINVSGFIEDLKEGKVSAHGSFGSGKKLTAHTQQNVNEFLFYEISKFRERVLRLDETMGYFRERDWKGLLATVGSSIHELYRYGKISLVPPAKLFMIPWTVHVYWNIEQGKAKDLYVDYCREDAYKRLKKDMKKLKKRMRDHPESLNWLERQYAKLIRNLPLGKFNAHGKGEHHNLR